MTENLTDIVDFNTLKPIIENPTKEQIVEHETANGYTIIEEYTKEKKKRETTRFMIQYADQDEMVIISPEIMKTLSKLKAKVENIPSILNEVFPKAKDLTYNKNHNLFLGFFSFLIVGILGVTMLISYGVPSLLPSEIILSSEILVKEGVFSKPLTEINDSDFGNNVEVSGENIVSLGESYTYKTGRKFKQTNYGYNNYSLCQIKDSQDTYITKTNIDDPLDIDGYLALSNKCNITGPIAKVTLSGKTSVYEYEYLDESGESDKSGESGDYNDIESSENSISSLSLIELNNQEIVDLSIQSEGLNYPKFMIDNSRSPVTQEFINLRSGLIIFGNFMLLLASIIEGIKILKYKNKLKKAIIKYQ